MQLIFLHGFLSSEPLRRGFAVAAAIVLLCVTTASAAQTWDLSSPTSRLTVVATIDGERLTYAVRLQDTDMIVPSQIDLCVADAGCLARGAVTATKRSATDKIEFDVPRKHRQIELKYNELKLSFASGGAVVFRAYDEGVAYRWETSLQGKIIVKEEIAEFRFPGTPHAWFPEEESILTHQERAYKYLPLNEVGPDRFCSTGVLIDLPKNHKIYISESDLAAYPGMFLRGVGEGKSGLVGKFSPFALETTAQDDRNVPVTKAADYLAETAGERTFPWRVMLVTNDDSQLLTSELVEALAPPPRGDFSWVKPGMAAWDWWNAINITGVPFRAGVNTETYKYFIDFAADYGIEYIVIDEGWSADSRDVLSVSPAVNLEELVSYGRKRDVRIILWVIWKSLDDKLEQALDKFESLGAAGIKVDFMQRDDQWMVEFYHRVAREAAKRRLLVDFHGAYKPTGLRRTYPNVLTSEGVTGLEQYKWGDQNANPEQELVLPFIRMVAGPMDYTPGALTNANRESWRWNVDHPMSLGTRCHQLAMYVVYESPLQMLADSPTRYRREADTMKFLAKVPTVWDDTVVLAAKVSDYVILARRSGDEWFLGGMTDWDSREIVVDLNFLPPGSYVLDTLSDGVNADRNGADLRLESRKVSADDKLTVKMAPAGGWAGHIYQPQVDE